MPSLNRNEKVQCGDCGNLYVRAHAARHRKSCQAGIISRPDQTFSTIQSGYKYFIIFLGHFKFPNLKCTKY